MAALQPQPQITTYEQYEAFSKERRIEVFDGQIFDMASPSQEHQTILTELLVAIRNYLRKKGSGCRVFPAPFDVKLFNSPLTVVQPDLMMENVATVRLILLLRLYLRATRQTIISASYIIIKTRAFVNIGLWIRVVSW